MFFAFFLFFSGYCYWDGYEAKLRCDLHKVGEEVTGLIITRVDTVAQILEVSLAEKCGVPA